MTTIDAYLDNYFGSLNSITKKIWKEKEDVRRSYKGQWDELNEAEKEDILESHLIGARVREKYENVPKEETPRVFPKTRVNCGEKIVVDFENDDGWTWRDEHSGPFSWMTRSQQDLTLEDLDDLDNPNKKPQMSRCRSRSPDHDAPPRRPRDVNNHEKNNTTNAEAAHTADEIFQKFGIAFSFGKQEESSGDIEGMLKGTTMSPIEEAKLLPGQQEYENDNFELGEDDYTVNDDTSTTYNNTSFPDDSAFDSYPPSEVDTVDIKRVSSASSNTSSGRRKSPEKSKLHKKNKGILDYAEAEVSLMNSDGEDRDLSGSFNHGQVSPVYLEKSGESSTDPRFSAQYSYADTLVVADSPSVLGSDDKHKVISEQPTRTFDIGDLANSTVSSEDTDLGNWNLNPGKDDEDNSVAKSGFDFLDNW